MGETDPTTNTSNATKTIGQVQPVGKAAEQAASPAEEHDDARKITVADAGMGSLAVDSKKSVFGTP